MSERARSVLERARALRHDAEGQVEPPALPTIERRGLLRRRGIRTASVLAVVVIAGAGAVDVVRRSAGTSALWPSEERHGPAQLHRLWDEAATYQWRLSQGPRAPRVQLTLASGWVGSTTLRHRADDGLVELVVAEVDQVTTTPCAEDGHSMVDAGTATADVAQRISFAPGIEERGRARRVTAFGRFAEMLRLRTTESARCPLDEPGVLLGTPRGDVAAPPPGSSIDVWVVDVGGRPVVVMASRTPGADARGRELLRTTLATVRLDVSRPD